MKSFTLSDPAPGGFPTIETGVLIIADQRRLPSLAKKGNTTDDNDKPRSKEKKAGKGNGSKTKERNSSKKNKRNRSRDEIDPSNTPAAMWMSGKVGIGWRIMAGDIAIVRDYDVDNLVQQVKTIPNLGYVLFNLSQAASGDRYLAPHSVLDEVCPGSCPKRDLFGELATAFQAEGYKVLVYMATEGPSKMKHGPQKAKDWDGTTSPTGDRWISWVEQEYGSSDDDALKKAFAEVIVKEYADRYGTKIDGWWFDHAIFGNIPLLHSICKEANGDVITAFNDGQKVPLKNNNPGLEDYTFGHPTPIRARDGELASSDVNLDMLTSIEDKSINGFFYANGQPSLGHMFMPMGETWNSGLLVWSEYKAVDWVGRATRAGGAWTWNVATNDSKSRLDPDAVAFATQVSLHLDLESNGGKKDGHDHGKSDVLQLAYSCSDTVEDSDDDNSEDINLHFYYQGKNKGDSRRGRIQQCFGCLRRYVFPSAGQLRHLIQKVRTR